MSGAEVGVLVLIALAWAVVVGFGVRAIRSRSHQYTEALDILDQDDPPRSGLPMREAFGVEGRKLFGLLMGAGFVITFIHDYAYRRADVTGTGDYEFWGLVSHAGTDMLIVTLVVSVAAVLWTGRKQL